MKSMFALVDCNNFYASCERVLNQKLANRPVIVLSEKTKAIGINNVWKIGRQYAARVHKYGITSNNIVCASPIQNDFFDIRNRKRSQSLMGSIDTINTKMGSDTIKYTAAGLIPWQKSHIPSQYCSPAYTNHWNHLPMAS